LTECPEQEYDVHMNVLVIALLKLFRIPVLVPVRVSLEVSKK
jgi:hypothetical protein